VELETDPLQLRSVIWNGPGAAPRSQVWKCLPLQMSEGCCWLSSLTVVGNRLRCVATLQIGVWSRVAFLAALGACRAPLWAWRAIFAKVGPHSPSSPLQEKEAGVWEGASRSGRGDGGGFGRWNVQRLS